MKAVAPTRAPGPYPDLYIFSAKVIYPFRRLPLLGFCLLLSGCFGAQPESAQPAPPSPVREFIINHSPGSADSSATLSDPEFGENIRIVLEQEFLSSTGETCRRATLFSQSGDAEVVIMCREGEEWKMAPRVWGQGLPGRR